MIKRFKCKNLSQDVNHNSKKNFQNVCVENWEKVKDSYNCLANDTLWKKIKLESKVNIFNYFFFFFEYLIFF